MCLFVQVIIATSAYYFCEQSWLVTSSHSQRSNILPLCVCVLWLCASVWALLGSKWWLRKPCSCFLIWFSAFTYYYYELDTIKTSPHADFVPLCGCVWSRGSGGGGRARGEGWLLILSIYQSQKRRVNMWRKITKCTCMGSRDTWIVPVIADSCFLSVHGVQQGGDQTLAGLQVQWHQLW